jgi:hypothetical protein
VRAGVVHDPPESLAERLSFSVTMEAPGASKSTTELSVAPWPEAATAARP